MKPLLPQLALVALALCMASTSGCAAMRATRQPGKRDMAVLEQGVPRSHVVAELGTPVYVNRSKGELVDTFRFVQGYTKTTKTARFLIHGTADFFTFGLWEVVGIPAEMAANGTEVQIEVHYDKDLNVDHVVVIKGDKAVHPPDLLAFVRRKPEKSTTRLTAEPASPQLAERPPEPISAPAGQQSAGQQSAGSTNPLAAEPAPLVRALPPTVAAPSAVVPTGAVAR